MRDRPHVLVIAGTDSSGGAGLVRDVQVITALGARATCAVTAVTAQTHSEVDGTFVLSSDVVRSQLRAALRAAPVGAIKVGMLGNAAIVRAVLEELPDRTRIPLIVDPVLCSSSGAALLDTDGVVLLRDHLFARSTLITPNLIEAATLLGRDQVALAEELLKFGSEYVLLKGGHGGGADAIDVLVSQSGSPTLLRAPRVNANLRGTGCGLSSAIAALLAAGTPMKSACEQAKEFIYKELLAAADSQARGDSHVSLRGRMCSSRRL